MDYGSCSNGLLSSCRNFNDWTNWIWRCCWIRSFCDAMISIRKEIETSVTDKITY
jgi:hypothetical protein